MKLVINVQESDLDFLAGSLPERKRGANGVKGRGISCVAVVHLAICCYPTNDLKDRLC